jgi:hypothetical protein
LSFKSYIFLRNALNFGVHKPKSGVYDSQTSTNGSHVYATSTEPGEPEYMCSLITESPHPLDISISVLRRKVNLTKLLKKTTYG